MAVDPIGRVDPRRDVAPLEPVRLSPIEREQQRREREERRRRRREPRPQPPGDAAGEGLDLRA